MISNDFLFLIGNGPLSTTPSPPINGYAVFPFVVLIHSVFLLFFAFHGIKQLSILCSLDCSFAYKYKKKFVILQAIGII